MSNKESGLYLCSPYIDVLSGFSLSIVRSQLLIRDPMYHHLVAHSRSCLPRPVCHSNRNCICKMVPTLVCAALSKLNWNLLHAFSHCLSLIPVPVTIGSPEVGEPVVSSLGLSP